tara:strand:- start:33 stop:1388 length:1356 start_codon:yes stop_codon:yes gene_type:complete
MSKGASGMDVNTLICETLGIQELNIEKLNFNREQQKLNIFGKLTFKSARCLCCNNSFFEHHQWHDKTIRVPTLGIYSEVYLHLKFPRGFCLICEKVTPPKLDFIHPEFKGLSCSFVETAGRLAEETTCASASRIMKCNRKTLWKIDQWRMNYMKNNLYQTPKNLDLSFMSADEVHFLTERPKKRLSPFCPRYLVKYITNLVCSKHSKILFNAPENNFKALQTCLKQLSKEDCEKVLFFALDMNEGYFNAVSKLCPNAEIAVDRYHLVESLNRVFNKLRQEEFSKAKKRKDEFQAGMLEAGRKFILMERNPALSMEEKNMLGKLKMLNTNINAGMLIMDLFHKLLDQKSLKRFRKKLAQWYQVVRESKLKSFKKFALKIMKYRKHIEAYIKSNLTTAVSEGLNNKIKVFKRAGYNYTNEDSFKNKILQRCGFLNSTYINTNFLYWHVPTPQN